MINLLFITNNPRAELVCGHFQQQMKVRIDLVADFDQGLKAVFEQRPSVVCIQEQIANVTGESVARHIQMLLGADAPAFVLLHEGGSKVKPVPRLFEHLVDLSDPFEQVSSNLCHALQQLLVNYRELLCPTAPQALAVEGVDIPSTSSEDASTSEGAETFPELKRVDDFSDLFELTTIGGPPAERPTSADQQHTPPVSSVDTQGHPATMVISQPEQPQVDTQHTPPQPPHDRAVAQPLSVAAEQQPGEQIPANEESIPVEELLQAVEETYLRRKRLLWVSLSGSLALVALAAVWWFWPRAPSFTAAPATPPAVSPPVAAPEPVAQQRLSSATQSSSPPRHEFPAFVKAGRRDPDFDAVQPGWSRFVTDQREYRLFYENNRLQAVQVLTLGGNGIAVAEIRRVLQELTGSDQYQVKQQSRKQGVWVEEASAHTGNAGLLIYRTSQRGPISAFVIARTP